MTMDEIATMSADERGQLFRIVADEAPETLGINVSPGVIEKDFWVCWLMGKLFALPLAKPSGGVPRILFKGGTCCRRSSVRSSVSPRTST